MRMNDITNFLCSYVPNLLSRARVMTGIIPFRFITVFAPLRSRFHSTSYSIPLYIYPLQLLYPRLLLVVPWHYKQHVQSSFAKQLYVPLVVPRDYKQKVNMCQVG